MNFLWILLVIGVLLMRSIANSAGKEHNKPRDVIRRPPGGKKPVVPIREVSKTKRAAMAQAEKWRAAKQQQDDAEQLHAIHVDTCESRLESLRVLHEAGILDNEEYAVRVARTKAKHTAGGST